jgi:hypothetical protein
LLFHWGMSTPAETIGLALAALLTGIAVPLCVQLFLVLRNVRKATAVLDARLDQTLKDVGEIVAELKRVSVPAPSLAAQLAAALPAIVAAVRAFRGGLAHDEAEEAAAHHHGKEKAA